MTPARPGGEDQWSLFVDLPVLDAATAVFSDRYLESLSQQSRQGRAGVPH